MWIFRFGLHVIKVLKKIPIRTIAKIITGFEALEFEEVYREYILVPIVYTSNPGQFLKIV